MPDNDRKSYYQLMQEHRALKSRVRNLEGKVVVLVDSLQATKSGLREALRNDAFISVRAERYEKLLKEVDYFLSIHKFS